ncbi:glucose oxidase [Diplodia corticola]|uniref:Glucose oxidase n=1 Tax=Diplodia corticola TaxID=236234 RepID=A0A1J9RJF7_9PEZI|nr:glucose oxidase [Diplodia corticola]OJD32699.1 glucose oxidase [Diplodia corticola]
MPPVVLSTQPQPAGIKVALLDRMNPFTIVSPPALPGKLLSDSMRCFFLTSPLVSLAMASPLAARSYDYIVVGGGAGGLVVANRLSETDASVLVIEAGGSAFDNPNVTAPDGYGLALNTALDWSYPSVAQRGGSAHAMHAGKVLGGSTAINGMSFTRAAASQIDAWEQIGNSGWNWQSMWQYYLKSEQYQAPGVDQLRGGAAYESSFHSTRGDLKVGYPKEQAIDDFLAPLNASYQELGIPYSPDVSGGDMHGFNVFPMMIDVAENVRSDAARSYYLPFRSRPNLHVWYNTSVTRLVWGGDDSAGNAVATGVEAASVDGTALTITAKKEVVVAAGALRTPAILELSGVGNPHVLSQANVTTKIALPGVGENLIDQVNTGMYYATPNNKTYAGLANYLSYPNVTDIYGAEAALSLASSVRSALPTWAAQIAAQNNNATNASTLLSLLEVQHSLLFDAQVPVAEILHVPAEHFGSEFWGTLPFSRGNIHIVSPDPSTSAAINPKYMMFDFDLDVQVGIAKFFRKLFAADSLSRLAGEELQPGTATVAEGAADDDWAAWILQNWRPNFHVLSTAIMMPREMGGVVSDRLKVYGTKNVRVVDGSVLPFQVCGHITSTIYAIAERASDLIKEDAGFQ